MFLILPSKAVSLNTATLVFGTVLPSSAAAPGSCIYITAQADLLYDITGIPEAPLAAPWRASTLACPTENSTAVPYTLLFQTLHTSNSSSFSSQQLIIKIQATQKVAGSPNMELRWHRTISLDFSTGNAAGNFDFDLQQAKPYTSKRHHSKQPLPPLEDLQLDFTTTNAIESETCVPLPEDYAPSTSSSLAAQGLVALLCLVAGIATGRAFSARQISSHNIHKKQTCEVACSPFIIETREKVKAAPKVKKSKWVRDGRLQRDSSLVLDGPAAGWEDNEDRYVAIEE